MNEQPKGISRRSLLKRFGAGAAIAWTAPVLTSFRAPALGQSSPVCQPGCPRCNFGQNCGGDCACVGIPVECFCADFGACQFEIPICQSDADCEAQFGPGSRCAPCVFDPECAETSCWHPCGGQVKAIPRGLRVLRPSR